MWKLRRTRSREPEQTRDELIAELLAGGFLEQELRLTPKSLDLLAQDPRTMDDFTYWCVYINAGKAQALVEGTSVTQAAVGGTFYVPADYNGSLEATMDAALRQGELRPSRS